MSTHSMQIALNRSVPVPEERAASQYVEHAAMYQVSNRWYRLALVGTCFAIAVMSAGMYRMGVALASRQPLVIRVSELGQPYASTDDAMQYQPREAELKHFLINWTTDHFTRIRATRRDAFRRELYFLDAPLAHAAVEEETRTKSIPEFLGNAEDEVEVEVHNVMLDDLRAAPYKATVTFDRVFKNASDRREVRRTRSVAHIVCTVMHDIPNTFIPVNPLGLVITYFRNDEAF